MDKFEERYPNFSQTDENTAIAGIKSFQKRVNEFKRTSNTDVDGLSELKCGAAKRFIDRIDTPSAGYGAESDYDISQQIALGGRKSRRVFALAWHAMHDREVLLPEQIQGSVNTGYLSKYFSCLTFKLSS